jgi:catechol 2,3-dioxygenase-like lactoylglutathione lyase family enzyme
MATGALITHVFVGVPVTNYASGRRWYEQFFGRPPDVVPKEDEAVWQITTTGLIYIVADKQRAGRALVVIAVRDLERFLAALAGRGLEIPPTETAGNEPMNAVFHDPDGNTIKVFAAPDTP